MLTILIGAFAVVLVATLTLVLRSSGVVAAAHAEGRKAGLREAVEALLQHSDEIVYSAPHGQLTQEVLKATIAHDFAVELRNRINRMA